MACQPRQVFTRFALAAAIASVLPTGRGLAQERDRSKIPDKYKWNTADIYPSEEAWREAKDRLLAEIPRLKSLSRRARHVGGTSRRGARAADAVEQGAGQGLRLRQHAVGPGHARQQVPGNAAGNGAGERAARRRSGVHRAGNPQDRSRDDRSFRRQRAAAQTVPDLPGRHPAPASAHQVGCRGEAARHGVGGRLRAFDHLRRLLGRRLPLSVGDPERRPDRQTRQLDLQRRAHVAEPRGSAEGDVVVLRGARRAIGARSAPR